MKKLFHKIHLWLSVPFGIFITLICFSGAMLVFEKEITEWCRPDLYFVKEVKEKPLPMESLMKKVATTLPDSVAVTGVTISSDAKRTWQVSLSKPRRASIYVNQYTGEITGRSERLPFYDTMFHLHRWMLGSSTGFGKLLVGISTLMLVVILITGILMWLTNKHKPLKKSMTISFTKGWPRFWHDLHVAGGIYATIFLLAIALTGLTWSFSWYRTGFYGMFGVETSASSHGSHSTGRDTAIEKRKHTHSNKESEIHSRPEVQVDRQTFAENENQTQPDKTRRSATSDEFTQKAGRKQHHGGHGHNGSRDLHPTSPYAHWQQVYENLTTANPDYRQITISEGLANLVPAERSSLRAGDEFYFETNNGTITGSKPYSAQDKSTKVRSTVYTVHVGSWGGLITRILTFLAALLGATLPLTGYYLWLKRLIHKPAHLHLKIED